jgi:hypothetical protein
MRRWTRGILAAAAAALAFPLSGQAADMNRPYAPPPAGAKDYPRGYGCFAVFHKKRGAAGLSLMRRGPEEVAVIRRMHYPNGRTLNHGVRSVTTGPGAWIELYGGRRFRRQVFEVGPDSMVNLKRPKIDSYRLHCVREPAPATYAPSYK